MIGLLLAGGAGSRLWPTTVGASKQLLQVFNKPMIYYSLSTLMLAGVRNVFVVVAPEHLCSYKRLLGNGGDFGIELQYLVQDQPNGIAETVKLLPDSHSSKKLLLALGDNLFFGSQVGSAMSGKDFSGALAFGVRVSNPSEFGVAVLDQSGKPISLAEKPAEPVSDIAIPGLYFLDESAKERAKALLPSTRGELEITSLLQSYLSDGLLTIEILPRGTAWLDTGKAQSLARASQFVEAVEANQGLLIGSPHEVAWRQGWATSEQIAAICGRYPGSDYAAKLAKLMT